MADRTNIIELNAQTYRLMEQPNGTRGWSAETIYLAGDVEADLLELIPWGRFGMGSSIFGVVPNEFDYGFDTDSSVPDQLGPGKNYSTVTLTSAGSVTKILPARDASGNLYVYVVNNSALLFKIRVDTMASTGTKTFAQVGSVAIGASPILTDLVVTKDGAAPGNISRTVTQPAGAFLIAMFGETCAIYYADAIAVNAVDTWASPTHTAYGGVGAKMQGATNTETLVFKSTAAGDLGTTGNFSRLQYRAIPVTSIDFSDAGVWQPGTPYQLPYIGESVTQIISYGRGPLCAQPSAVTQFDVNYNSGEIFTMSSFVNDENGKHMKAFGRRLLIPTAFDLMDSAQGNIGLRTLQSNTSPVAGYPTALAHWGDDLFVAYYTGTDTWILRLRQRRGENVPQEFLIFPLTKLSAKVCRAMHVMKRANGDTLLMFGNGTDLSYMIIDPPASVTYKTGGQHFLPTFGDTQRFFQLESLAAFGSGLDANNTWAVAVSVDEAAYSTLATWATTGRLTFHFTPGTSDTGTRLQIRLTCTLTGGGNPLLKGGGLVLKGKWRAGEMATRIVATIEAGSWGTASAGVGQDWAATFAALKAFASPALSGSTLPAPVPVTLKWLDFFGDSGTHKVIIEKVRWIEGPGTSGAGAQPSIEVTMRTLLGTT